MTNYRVDYIDGRTGRRTHRDYITLRGVLNQVDRVGHEHCVIKQYSEQTFCFEPIAYDKAKEAAALR